MKKLDTDNCITTITSSSVFNLLQTAMIDERRGNKMPIILCWAWHETSMSRILIPHLILLRILISLPLCCHSCLPRDFAGGHKHRLEQLSLWQLDVGKHLDFL